MEGLVTIAVIAVLAAVALILAVLAKLGSLSREVEDVKKMLRGSDAPAGARRPRSADAQTSADVLDLGAGPSRPRRTEPVAEPEAPKAQPVAVEPPQVMPTDEPTAADRFWATVEDWFCVRGKFAPKGMTRSFFSASAAITYAFRLAQYGMVLALTILGLGHRAKNGNAYCWAFTTAAAVAWAVGGACGLQSETMLKYHLLFAAALHGVMSVVSRRRNRDVAPVMMVLPTLFGAVPGAPAANKV